MSPSAILFFSLTQRAWMQSLNQNEKQSEFDVSICPGVVSLYIESETFGKYLIKSIVENE